MPTTADHISTAGEQVSAYAPAVPTITSEELDGVLEDAETLETERPSGGVGVRVYVSVDAATLNELERRAAARSAGLNDIAADALRAGARAA